MNKRGFTLIELLGVIVILSIIMVIAIPNITSTLERSKRDQYLVDAKKMISLVEYELRKGEVPKPATNKWIKITLQYLATSDLEKDADGISYSLTDSYVVVTRSSDGYLEYYVNLVSNHGGNTANWHGIRLTKQDQLSSDDRYNLVKKNISLPSTNDITSEVGGSPSSPSQY